MKIKSELILIFVFTLIYIGFGFVYQKQISYNDGLGWDGRDYYKVALAFKNNELPEARAPFVYRMGTPFLVSKLFPDDLQNGFKIINVAAGALVFFALWYFLYISNTNTITRIILLICYITYWQNPLRFSFFYPIHSDPVAVLFLFINLIIAYKYYMKAQFTYLIFLIITSTIGVFFREITLIPALALVLSQIKLIKYRVLIIDKRLLVPLISGALVIFITHAIATPTDTYNFFNSAIGWIYRKSSIMYLHSLLLAVGPIVFLAFYFYKDSFEFLKENRFIMIYLLIILFVSYAGGSDTERLIMWGIPGIYLLISNVIMTNKRVLMSKLLITVLIFSQLLSNRAFLLLPDHNENALSSFPFLTPLTNDFRLLDLWVIHANSRFIIISAIEYLLLFVLLFILIKFSEKLKQN